MTPDPALRRRVLALVLLSLAAYAIAEHSPQMFLLWSPIAIATWWLAPRRLVPRWTLSLLVIAVVIRSAVGVWERSFDVTAFSTFLVWILLIKLCDEERPRDVSQIVTLTIFLTIGAVLTSNSLLVGLLLLVMLPLLIATVMRLQVYTGVNAAARRRSADAAASSPPAPSPDMGRSFSTIVGTLALAALLICAAVFIFFPRGVAPTLSVGWGTETGRISGFADSVRLGEEGLISQSAMAVIEFDVRDREGRTLGAPGQTFYLRGAVLDTYDAGVWTRGRQQRPKLPSAATSYAGRAFYVAQASERPPAEPLRPPTIASFVIRSSPRDGPLFTLWRPEIFRFPKSTELRFHTGLRVFHARSPGRIEYSIECSDEPTDPPAPSGQDGADAPAPKRVTFPSAIVARVAREWVQQADIAVSDGRVDPAQAATAARAIESALRKRFAYTLDLTAPPLGQDPIDWFLTAGRRGNCEYFASAMTAMCRSLGIDARVISGYVATEYDTEAQKYIVRSSNAHAWVEAEINPGQWRRFDPTPPADFDRIHQPPADALARFVRWFDNVEYAWNISVVAFDEDSRARLFGAAGGAAPDGESWLTRAVERLRRDPAASESGAFLTPDAARLLVGTLLLASLLLIAIIALRRLLRSRLFRRIRDRLLPGAHLWFYRDLLDALDAAGHAKPSWKPPLDHLRSVGASLAPEPAAAARRLASLYYQVRFAGLRLSPEDEARAAEDLRVLRNRRPTPAPNPATR
jgi:transglutaminase-like putative cysteine protease